MNLIIDFYKELDTLNLIIFWGIIIVILLLLIFSIIIVNKNKKLKQIIETKKQIENSYEEIPIIKKIEVEKKEELIKEPVLENKIIVKEETKIESQEKIEEEKKFIAEEHVMKYNEQEFSLPNIKKTTEMKTEPEAKEITVEETTTIKNAPYQRNVLREMSLNQTSPIGIVKPTVKQNIEIEKAKELQKDLSEEKDIEYNYEKKAIINSEIKREKTIDTKNEVRQIEQNNYKAPNEYRQKTEIYLEKNVDKNITATSSISKENNNKEKYLQEVSKKLAEAELTDDIDRTEYELKQEEDAIISYEELMQKKDTLKMIDEEDAVISIEELIRKQEQKEKLYNITEEEENDKFINELKNFRSDL